MGFYDTRGLLFQLSSKQKCISVQSPEVQCGTVGYRAAFCVQGSEFAPR